MADDHAIVRKGLRQILNEGSSPCQVDEASSGQEVLKKVYDGAFDILVLDISLPDRNGLELVREIKSVRPKLPILMLSVHPEEQYAIRALKAGVSGYLNKESAPEQLVQAIERIVAGGRYISPTLAETLAANVGGDGEGLPHEALSDREFTVLLRIGAGKSVSEIADELGLSVKTVSTYRARILEKMNMNSNADLIRYVIDHRLV
jgi:two-component system, NarL family, invasion response regulator UvrY